MRAPCELCPHAPDPTLGADEFFVFDYGVGRIRRVKINGWMRRAGYAPFVAEVCRAKTGELVRNRMHPDGLWRMAELYDNVTDCAAQTHPEADRWERLRENK